VACELPRKFVHCFKNIVKPLTCHSNINPNHIVEESGVLNKSRINCFLYQDARITEMELPRQNNQRPQEAYIQRISALLVAEMNQCRALHHIRCLFHWDAWMQDHPANNANMADVYAAITESEAEAEERLTEDDWEEGDTILPQSSM
jgi:hypothetical protein